MESDFAVPDTTRAIDGEVPMSPMALPLLGAALLAVMRRRLPDRRFAVT